MVYDRYYNEFSSLSIAQLGDVRRALDEAIDTRKKNEIRALREDMNRRAAELGIDLKDLLGKKSESGTRVVKKVAPKYRMVAPGGEVHEWTGRGIKPKAFAPYSKEELDTRFLIR